MTLYLASFFSEGTWVVRVINVGISFYYEKDLSGRIRVMVN